MPVQVRFQQCRVRVQVHGMKNFRVRVQVRCMKKFKPSSVYVLCMNFFEFLRSQSSLPAYMLEAYMLEVGHNQFCEKDVIKTQFVKVT